MRSVVGANDYQLPDDHIFLDGSIAAGDWDVENGPEGGRPCPVCRGEIKDIGDAFFFVPVTCLRCLKTAERREKLLARLAREDLYRSTLSCANRDFTEKATERIGKVYFSERERRAIWNGYGRIRDREIDPEKDAIVPILKMREWLISIGQQPDFTTDLARGETCDADERAIAARYRGGQEDRGVGSNGSRRTRGRGKVMARSTSQSADAQESDTDTMD